MGLERNVTLQYAKRQVLGIREDNGMSQTKAATYIIVYFG